MSKRARDFWFCVIVLVSITLSPFVCLSLLEYRLVNEIQAETPTPAPTRDEAEKAVHGAELIADLAGDKITQSAWNARDLPAAKDYYYQGKTLIIEAKLELKKENWEGAMRLATQANNAFAKALVYASSK